MQKTKLVVYREHTLGYILPEMPNVVQHLHASILRGATFSLSKNSDYLNEIDFKDVRLASEKDFEDFNVSFAYGYKTSNEYEYQTWD